MNFNNSCHGDKLGSECFGKVFWLILDLYLLYLYDTVFGHSTVYNRAVSDKSFGMCSGPFDSNKSDF